DDRDHGLVIHARVIEAVQKVNRARAAGRQAHADLAGELGVRAGHERRHLLVAHLHQLEFCFFLTGIECTHQAVDAVAWIAVDALYPPLDQPPEQKFRNVRRHVFRICVRVRMAKWRALEWWAWASWLRTWRSTSK